MSSSKKVTYIILWSLMLAFTILVGAFSHKVNANSEGTFVHFSDNLNAGFTVEAFKKSKQDESQEGTIKINNNEYVLLEKDSSFSDIHKIFFNINSTEKSGKYITSLYVNAYLNGRAINVNVKNTIDAELQKVNESLSIVKSLNFEISRATTITYKDSTDVVEDLQGHYEFDFKVGIYDVNQNSSYSLPLQYDWYKFEFIVIDESQYSAENQEIAFGNVEDKTSVDGIKTFINNYSFVESGVTNFGYADLSFDAERYKLIISKTYQGKVSKIETLFNYFTDSTYSTLTNQKTSYGKLTFKFEDKDVSFNLQRSNNLFIFKESNFTFNSSSTSNYSMPLFYDLGEYEINSYYQVYQDGELLFDSSLNSPVSIPKISLVIYGFNINYAYNVIGQKYFTKFQNEITNGLLNDLSISADFSSKLNLAPNEINVPSTNQAPVWFNSHIGNFDIRYFHSSGLSEFMSTFGSSSSISSFLESVSEDIFTEVNKNHYFTEAGYYFVECDYARTSSSNLDKKSVFIFQIKNNTPSVSIMAKTTKGGKTTTSIIPSGGYTNGNVHIYMDELGIFDSEIKTEYSINTNFANTYSNYQTFTPKIGTSTEFVEFSAQGKYSIKVMFGIQSCSYYTFTIDKTDIKNYVSAFTVKKMSQTSTNYLTNTRISDSTITNSDFTLIIQEKPSKAKISAKLITYDIESFEPTQTDVFESNTNKKYISSRFRATYASSPSDYNNIVPVASAYVDQSYVFTEHKIYIFQISDESGFEYNHIVYLDKSSANVLQFDSNNQLADVTDFNVVSSKTIMKWSDYKALEFLDKSSLSGDARQRNDYAQNILKNNPYFDYNGISFLLLVDINQIRITSTDLNGTITTNTGDIYQEYSNSEQFTIYGLESEAIVDGLNNFGKIVGEKIYQIEIFDESGNKTVYEIEVNMDKSLGKMFTTSETEIKDSNYRKNILKLNQAGSLNYLVFEWKDAESGAFKIESLTYDFYPLTYEKYSTNFPYAQNASKSGNLLDEFFVNNDASLKSLAPLNYSTPINVVSATFTETINGEIMITNRNVTEPGKYVIKRTYVGTGNVEEFDKVGDTKERTYVFLVDRNPILDYPQSNLIPESYNYNEYGNAIKLVFGNDSSKEFKEFYRQSISTHTTSGLQIGLESNLLPIQVKVPKSKYSTANDQGAQTPDSVSNYFDLIVTLEKYNEYGSLEWSNTYNEDITNPDVGSDGYITIPSITTSGYYKLMIKDRSILPNEQISPIVGNTNYFAFYVNLSGPQASILSSNTKATIAGESPLSMSIKENSYLYGADTTIVSSVKSYRRDISIDNPNFSATFEPLPGTWSNSIKLDILNTKKVNTMFQYMFEVTYIDGRNKTTHYSPLPTDYNDYKLAGNGSSTKDNYIILTFDEPDEVYMASIDSSDISIIRYEKINGQYSNPLSLKPNIDYILQQRLNPNTHKVQYSIQFYTVDKTNPNKEYRFDISYHFKGDAEYFNTTIGSTMVSYYSASQSIYVDKSAPKHNITRLAQLGMNPLILSKANMSAYNSDYYYDASGVYYFANRSDFDFAIDSSFQFTQPKINDVIDTQEGNQIYYRKYHKYDESKYDEENKNEAYQAIVPGDKEFISGTSAKLRFNSVDPRWTAFEYDKTFIEQASIKYPGNEVYGYYEIVEIDAVGNHTIYTILYDNPAIAAQFNTNQVEGLQITDIRSADTSVSSYNSIEFKNILANDSWFTVSVDTKEYLITPKNKSEIINQINNHLNNGTSVHSFKLSNRFGQEIAVNIYISTSGKILGIKSHSTIPEETGYYRVIFDDDAEGLIMESIRAFKFDSETKEYIEITDNENRPIDSNGTLMDPKTTRTYYFEKGIYQFIIEDNFRKGANATKVSLNIDTGFETYSFDFSAEETFVNGKHYTTDNITLNANLELYTVTATRNGESVNVTNSTFVFVAPSESPEASITSGGEYEYVITLLDNITGQKYVHTFVIYNLFPAINAENSKEENMNKILATDSANVSTFTADAIYLHWNTSGFKFAFDFKLRKYTALNSNLISEQSVGGSGISVSDKGAYELFITNKTLRNTRSIWFVIRESNISMYSVSEKLGSGALRELTPSETLLDVTKYKTQIETLLQDKGKTYTLGNVLKVKNYFSVSEFEITVDGDKGLNTNWGKAGEEIIFEHTGNLNENFITKIVVVYGLSPYNYLDVFAVTKILSNSRFLNTISYQYYGIKTPATETSEAEYGDIKVDVQTASFSNIIIYENPITLSWNSYYGIQQNKVYMTYTFNGKLIKTIVGGNGEKTSLILSDDGEYKFTFKDLAGNINLFGDGNYSEFTITIKSKVKVNINEQESIYGIVYNNEVPFTILEANELTSLSVVVFKNGNEQKEIKITKTSPTYTFTESGFYKIYVSGTIRSSESTIKQLQEEEYVFTIINPNESRFAYEFSSINGYEVIKVTRNGFDITNEILKDASSITNLVLSEDINGVGKYGIVIKANFINSLRESTEFAFDVWINNKTPSLDISVKRNEVSVDPIVIKYNSSALYEQLGECKIIIGNTIIDINAETVKDDENSEATINVAGTYYITLLTDSGNVISIYKVTKQDPLNTLSIILIVLGSLLLIAGIYLFYRLRVKMKIK